MPMFQQASDQREQVARQRLAHCRWGVSDGKVYPRELVREILGGLAVLVLGSAFLAGLWIITP